VWAIEQNQNSNNPSRCDGTPINPAALHAFNASNLAAPELYHSSGSDGVHTAIGHVHSFPTPTIFKGQVYMGTDTEVDVWAM
jgi:hypothetical protein